MNKPIIYSQEQGRTFDILSGWNDQQIAAAFLEQDLAGSTIGTVSGLVATPTGPASLTINLAAGRVNQQAPIDSTSYGSLPSNGSLIQQQGFAAGQQVTLSTGGLSSGQSQWALIEAQFNQVDSIAVGDPTGGLLLYFNSANPSQPLEGPGGDSQTQPTTRNGVCAIKVLLGSPATTGSEVPPNPDAGWLPLYLIDLTFGQTQILSNQILVSGPSVGTNVPSNYPGAPFLAGLLNKHHSGTPGQAPQIDLTAEVKNLLPLVNLPASNTTGGIAAFKRSNGNPNGNVAGNTNVNGANDICWDFTNNLLYICTTTGTSSTAVWTSVVGGSTNQFAGGTSTGTANAQVVATTTPSGFAKTPGQIVTFTVGPGPNTTATTLNVDGTGASAINKTGPVPLTGGELTVGEFVSVIWTGTVYLLQSATLGQLATLNIGEWLKNDGGGNLTIKNGANTGDDGSGNFVVLQPVLPQVGAMTPYAGTSAPTGWLVCNGQAVSRTGATAALFAVCSIAYGSGDGVTTFNLPDLRGRVPAGADGGVGRLTTATMSSQNAGGIGGLEAITLTVGQLPIVTPQGTITNGAITTSPVAVVNSAAGNLCPGGGSLGNAQGTSATQGASTFTGVSFGSNQAHQNVQPTQEVGCYIIKT